MIAMKYIYITILAFVLALCACNTASNRVKMEEFTVNLNSPNTVLGEIEVQFDTFLGLTGLRKSTITLLYFPREDVVSLQYKYDFYTYNQFWNRTARHAFIMALQKYNEEYDARELNRNERNSTRKYNTVGTYVTWQQFTFTYLARANTTLEIGYTFKERNPYFSVNQRKAEFINTESRDDSRTSPAIMMFFTRAQAAELAEYFDPGFLNELSPTSRDVPRPVVSPETSRDSYE